MHACSFSVVSCSLQPLLFVAHCQAPLSMEFSRQEYWSGLLLRPPGDLPDPGIKPRVSCFLHWQADSLLLHRLGSPESAFPSESAASTWGPDFIALEPFVPESNISCPLSFSVLWKFARSSWLFFESLASLPRIFQAYFFHWPDVLMCPMYIPHLSLLSALSQSEMWNDPCFHWHSSVLGFYPLTKPFMWRKLLIQDSDYSVTFYITRNHARWLCKLWFWLE